MTNHLHTDARHYQPRELVYCERCGAVSASMDTCLCCTATGGLTSVEELIKRANREPQGVLASAEGNPQGI